MATPLTARSKHLVAGSCFAREECGGRSVEAFQAGHVYTTGTSCNVQGGLAASEEDEDALAHTMNTTNTYWYAKVRPMLEQP